MNIEMCEMCDRCDYEFEHLQQRHCVDLFSVNGYYNHSKIQPSESALLCESCYQSFIVYFDNFMEEKE